MYYVLRLSDHWLLSYGETGKDEPIEKKLVEDLKRLFPRCSGSNYKFGGLHITIVPPSKLANIQVNQVKEKDLSNAVYYILKLADKWFVVDEASGENRAIDKIMIDLLNLLFPLAVSETKMFHGLRVSIVPQGKLGFIDNHPKNVKVSKSVVAPTLAVAETVHAK